MIAIKFQLSSDAERRLKEQTKRIYDLLRDMGADFTESEIQNALIDGIIRSLSTEDFKTEIAERGLAAVLETFMKKYPKRVPESIKKILRMV